MFYVVGSGPSGIAAAKALLDQGAQVTLLDVGTECEPERLVSARRLAAIARDKWTDADLAPIRSAIADNGKIPLKLSYGSTFPYGLSEMESLSQIGTKCFLSLARGGLSNVWGAAVLPNTASDLAGWPVSLSELEPHYRAVAQLMPIAGEADALEARFPFYHPPESPLRSSNLAASLLQRMQARRRQLESAGMTFGKSRLAVRAHASDGGLGCQYTGLCLSGCPHFAIWNASQVLEAMMHRSNFTYQPGVMIDRVEPLADGAQVRLLGTRLADRSPLDFVGTRAILACGPVSSSRIVFDSLGIYDEPAMLQFQPYFLLPLVAARGAAAPDRERLHTLAQLFLEVLDPSISEYTIHLQIYTFNEFIARRLELATNWLGPLGSLARRPFLGRLLVIQGYLHSSEAPGIRVTARADPSSGRARLELVSQPSETTRNTIRRLARKLLRHAPDIGAAALPPLLEVGLPGDGNHIGGIFPHSKSPGRLQTDLFGQLPGLPRVHLVDSSVLPTLGATTFTYTTMANAHRIGNSLARLDS